MSIKEYSTLDICRLLNFTRSRLQQWLDKNFIKPSIFESEGLGSKNLFSMEDIVKISLLKLLSEAGLVMKEASQICCDANINELLQNHKYVVLNRYNLNTKYTTRLKWCENLPAIDNSESDFSIIVNLDRLKNSFL